MQDFYFTNPTIGQGLPVLSKNGAIAKQRLQDYISRLLLDRGYTPLASPHIGNLGLFEKSGHYPYYKDSMFPVIQDLPFDQGNIVPSPERYVLKPMNCPFHIMAYEQLGVVSYKQLPIKFYEFGQVYRNEDSGALNGLFRVRSFTQDDGHLFCSQDQISEVVGECLSLVQKVCEDFKLKLKVKVSIRDEDNSAKYIGDNETWNFSELSLCTICGDVFGQNYTVEKGGAAFYGPKIDFIATDSMNREWQLGTVQLDFNLPERFNLRYVNSSSETKRPVLIHRALLGSLERFLAVLLENDLLPDFLQPFNFGVVWIGEDEAYLDTVVTGLRRLQVYPTVVRNPKHISEGLLHCHLKGIKNIVIIGKREEAEHLVSWDKCPFTFEAFMYEVSRRFKL
jgi:threonyl-tRNA synthetase